MRFLFLATRYSIDAADPYMTDELAAALIARGHAVDVLLVNWDSPPRSGTTEAEGRSGERVVIVAPRAVSGFGRLVFRATKLLLSSRRAAAAIDRQFGESRHDAVIAWTPALSMGAALRRAVKRGIRHRVLIIFDFFPACQRDMGSIRSSMVFQVAKMLEDRLYRLFTSFIANLPGNADYLREHFPVRPGASIHCSPIWADTSMPPTQDRRTVRARFGLPLDRPIAIFGGQLSEGRGLEQITEAARIGEAAGAPTLYLFVGDGRLRGSIVQAAAACKTVRVLPPVPRSDYLSVVAACDVGMVATVKEFKSWAFPSKTIDYLRAGIPFVTSVEAGSDYPALLQPYRVSANVECGDAAALQSAVESLVKHRPRDLRQSARRCLDEVFDVSHAAETLLRAVGARDERPQANRKPIVTKAAVTA